MKLKALLYKHNYEHVCLSKQGGTGSLKDEDPEDELQVAERSPDCLSMCLQDTWWYKTLKI